MMTAVRVIPAAFIWAASSPNGLRRTCSVGQLANATTAQGVSAV